MTSLNDVLLAMSNVPVDDPIAEIWGRGLQGGGYTVIEYTGTLPITINANGQPLLDYRIYGNTEQTGTPTPENPIMPIGVGERTENIMDVYSSWGNKVVYYSGVTFNFSEEPQCITINGQSTDMYPQVQIWGKNGVLHFENGKTYTALIRTTNKPKNSFVYMLIQGCDAENNWSTITTVASDMGGILFSVSKDYVNFRNIFVCQRPGITYDNMKAYLMIIEGSTALPYEPYGYKLPILSNSTITNIYLGESQTTRQIGKFDLSQATWEATGSPGLLRTTDIPNIRYTSSNLELGNGLAEKYQIHTGAGMSAAVNCIAIDTTQVSVNTGNNFIMPTGIFYYALATPETAVVNEPLMKIGDYTDTVSMEQAGVSIPTNKGTTVIDYNGTTKPSQMYIKYLEVKNDK